MENKVICMRGHEERFLEVKEFFEQHGADNAYSWDCNLSESIYYIDVVNVIRKVNEDSVIAEKLLPHLTELPPLEEKIEVTEFWLKPTEPVIVRDEENDFWNIDIFAKYTNGEVYPFECIGTAWSTCLPYNRETEKLVNTQNNPETKYVFKGVISFFNEK